MSYTPVYTQNIIRNNDLSDSQKVLLIEIQSYCYGSKRFCWPSTKTLSDALGKTVRAIQQGIAALVDLGYIVREKRDHRKGFYITQKTRPAEPPTNPPEDDQDEEDFAKPPSKAKNSSLPIKEEKKTNLEKDKLLPTKSSSALLPQKHQKKQIPKPSSSKYFNHPLINSIPKQVRKPVRSILSKMHPDEALTLLREYIHAINNYNINHLLRYFYKLLSLFRKNELNLIAQFEDQEKEEKYKLEQDLIKENQRKERLRQEENRRLAEQVNKFFTSLSSEAIADLEGQFLKANPFIKSLLRGKSLQESRINHTSFKYWAFENSK